MIVNTVAKHAGVLLPALAISVHADLNIDHTCTTAQKARLNAAFITAKSVAEKGIIRTDAINTNNLEASEISIEEVHRVNRLMATFFKVGGTDPNYGKALFGIEHVLSVLSQVTESSVPKIWCGTPETTQDDPDPSGKYVKYTTYPDTGLPVLKNGGPSFIYISYHFGKDKGYQWGPPGEPICGGGDIQIKATSDAAVPDEQFFIFCDYAFTRPGLDALPTTFAGRSADLSAYPGTPLMDVTTNQDGDQDDLSMTMLHEMVHFYVQGVDATLNTPISFGSNVYLYQAYGYVGATALANQGFSEATWANPDSCVLFALGCYLLGNDWSLNRAFPLPPPLPDLTIEGDNTKKHRRRGRGGRFA